MEKARAILTTQLVKKLSGKPMEDWFKVLDEQGAKDMKHAGIFALVSSIEGLKPLSEWNRNLLTTTYEWDRRLKQRGEKENGFEISVSKTMPVPVAVLYQSWADATLRQRWMPGKQPEISKATENKSLRMLWTDKATRVSVALYRKGETKTQVVVQHMKIADAEQAAAMKHYWSERLEALLSVIA
jgi:uncharacterized protein YndB with AHSA1/START domain